MKQGISAYTVGETFDNFLLIKEVWTGTASNGKPFLTIFFVDSTGEIDAKLWDASKEDEKTFSAGVIVKVVGDIIEYRGSLQLRIKSIRPSQVTDNVNVADFLQKAPVDKEELQEQMMEAVFEMTNPNLQRIVRAFLKKYEADLYVYPAASKNHHAFVSGLAFHVVSMLKIAKSLCDIYPELNKDLLYAGIILHDIGKLHELSGVVSTSYTTEGTLLGHISIMSTEIKEVADELNIEGEEVVLLQHIILSHHGKGEWGSPKPPLIREAEIIHFIDIIDAKMNMLQTALDKTTPGAFTERMFAMDNRSFYKPTIEGYK